MKRPSEDKRNKKIFYLAGFIVGDLIGMYLAHKQHVCRQKQEQKSTKQEVKRWEDEGGSVPEVKLAQEKL